jgi:hypothetical protein
MISSFSVSFNISKDKLVVADKELEVVLALIVAFIILTT